MKFPLRPNFPVMILVLSLAAAGLACRLVSGPYAVEPAPSLTPARTAPPSPRLPSPTAPLPVPATAEAPPAVGTSPVTEAPDSPGLATAAAPALEAAASGCFAVGQPRGDQAGLGDRYYPELGNGGYDVGRYSLALSVDLGANFLQGRAVLEITALEDLPVFNLDLIGLQVAQVAIDGQAARFSQADDELTITPPAPLAQGQQFSAAIDYSGRPQSVVPEAIPISMGWNRFDKGIYVASEPYGAATFYPVNDHPCDKALYHIEVTVPMPYSVAANGVLVEMRQDGNNRTFVFEPRDPIASYLVTVNIGEYKQTEQAGPNGITIRNYFPSDLVAQGRAEFGATADMIAFFSDTFGAYPFETYGAVVVPDPDINFALETQTLSLFGLDVLTNSEQDEGTIAHELAHQWFGDSVSLEQWSDIWLNEGFASYATMLWIEHRYGASALERYVNQVYRFLAEEKLPPPGTPPPDDLFNESVYQRGALTLHALRRTVGDGAFFEILRTYYARFAGSNASTADFIAVAEEISGQDLQDLFDAWLYDLQTPSLPF